MQAEWLRGLTRFQAWARAKRSVGHSNAGVRARVAAGRVSQGTARAAPGDARHRSSAGARRSWSPVAVMFARRLAWRWTNPWMRRCCPSTGSPLWPPRRVGASRREACSESLCAALLGVLVIVANGLLHYAGQAAVRHAHGWRPRIAYSRFATVICSSRLARSGRGA